MTVSCIRVEPRCRRILLLASCVLLAMQPSSPSLAQATPSAPQIVALKAYLPDFKRLQQASDWVGLERLARQALSAVAVDSGPDGVDVARAASWQALALKALGRTAEAEPATQARAGY
jgi:hypothetical protein